MDATTASRKLADARLDYTRGGLVESDLLADPFDLFSRWYDEAAAAGIYEPNAMVVATATLAGAPSARFVLLKGMSPAGFVFFTNLGSAKGSDLAENPRCSLLFPWHPLERQVRVEGSVSLVPRADVDEYFASRPRRSRVGAWASHQSSVVGSRDELDAATAAVEERFPDEVPVPEFWGGYLVAPTRFEFWQGRQGRMHDRLVYERAEAGWSTYRLAP